MPRQLILDPVTADPSPYGLLSVAQFPAAGDTHWQAGVTWQSVCVTGLGGTFFDPCVSPFTSGGSSTDPGQFTPTTQLQLRGATAFLVYAEFDCSPVGNAEAERIGNAALQQATGWQAERAFWTGTAGGQGIVYPHLAHNGAAVFDSSTSMPVLMQSAVVTGGSATTDIVEGLGYLEKQIANCNGGVGVIHVPVEALPTLDAWGLVKVNGQVLRTLNGNKVAVGAGYPGSAPSGAPAAAGTSWIYATGPVFGYAGTVRVTPTREALDRTENTIRMIAQRPYVLGWNCCHAAALVQLGVPAV